MKTSLDNFPKKAITTKVVTTFQSLIITLSNFVFNCQNNLQIKGSAMGTISACPMQIYLWIILEGNVYLRICKEFH